MKQRITNSLFPSKKPGKVVWLFLLAGLLGMQACSPDPDEAFATLKQLEGQWKSKGTVVVFEKWKLENDSLLSGYTFSEQNGRLLILERYLLEKEGDSIRFVILRPDSYPGRDDFPLVKARFGKFTFENPEAVYPNRVIIDFDSDSLFLKRKENIRGKKEIQFEMKRWK